ncbi:hypothetical protein VTK56DRAFT_4529 [Thermocarpiscus australiensis]
MGTEAVFLHACQSPCCKSAPQSISPSEVPRLRVISQLPRVIRNWEEKHSYVVPLKMGLGKYPGVIHHPWISDGENDTQSGESHPQVVQSAQVLGSSPPYIATSRLRRL